MFQSHSGVEVATSANCIVHGGRGAYYEFDKEHLNWDIIYVPDDQKYRLASDWVNKVYYIEYRTNFDHIKIYWQKRYVGYAEYLPDKYYIAVEDLEYEGDELPVKVHKSVRKAKISPKTRQITLDDI